MEEAAGRPLEVMLLVTSLQKEWLCAIDLELMVADVVPISESSFKPVFSSSADEQFRWEHSHALWKEIYM